MSKLFDDASLAMIPSAYKDGKLYSIRPTDGSGDFTFSRGSNLAATRVDVNGLIEKGRENLLLQSNQLDTTWLIGGGGSGLTLTGGQADRSGGNTAWLIDEVTNDQAIYQNISSNGVQTFSIYAKAGTNDWMRLGLGGGAFSHAYFDLVNGVLGNTLNIIDSSIESAGNGWWRCSVTANKSVNAVYVYPSEANNSAGTNGSIYIQDAQLEAGLVATDYIETGASTAQAGILEDMPRLDYSGGASCPALLLEPQRSNLVAHSEYYGSSEWSKRTSDSTAVPVVTNNYAVSPEGVKNASRVVVTKPSTDNDFAVITDFGGVTKSAGDKFASSVYLKATDASQVGKIVDIYSYESGGGYWTIKSHTLTDDWVRVDAVSTANTSTGNVELLNIGKARASAGGTTLANMATDFLVYGAQFEEGSYPTSYIPTYGSSVTRSRDQADNQSLNPVLGNGNISVMYDFVYDVVGREGSGQIFLLYSNNNSLGIKGTQSTDRRLQLFSYGDFTGTIGFNEDVPYQTRHKVVFRVTGEVVELFYNGVKQSATISGAALGGVYNWSRIKLDPTNAFLAGLNQLAVFPTALTDSECIALTTI